MAIRRIGRFSIKKVLGEGTQAVVYRCFDPQLQRHVAIKSLRLETLNGSFQKKQLLLQEARVLCKIDHPSIVSIYEVGEHDKNPYLVFEYVEGTLLSDLLRNQNLLPIQESLRLIRDIIKGIAHAHTQRMIHGDLKPANILINKEGVPKIMDFGIAQMLSGAQTTGGGFSGSPRYRAPEYISERRMGKGNDVFALGLILYEMITGAPLFQGSNAKQILGQITHQEITVPSRRNPAVDEGLDHIILKALERNPASRYQDASEMLQSLEDYFPSVKNDPTTKGNQAGTIEFFLRRIQRKQDFPALSQSISQINRIAYSDDKAATDLASVIIKDFALTNKILRTVNAAYYGRYSGNVSTISRAVVVLGFDGIRSIAARLILLEHLKNKTKAGDVGNQLISALHSGIIAERSKEKLNIQDGEELFLCAMFHNLGCLLTTFYSHEEAVEIQNLMQHTEVTEQVASRSVLGLSFQDLGIAIAKEWSFPETIIRSMCPLSGETPPKSEIELEKIRLLACFANELSQLIATHSAGDLSTALEKLKARFAKVLEFTDKELHELVDFSRHELTKMSKIVGLDATQSPIVQNTPAIPTTPHDQSSARETRSVLDDGVDTSLPQMVEEASIPCDGKPLFSADAQLILTEGIQDISAALASEYSVNDVFRMILEVMYRALGSTRTLVFILNSGRSVMEGRFGFGPDIGEILEKFVFPISYQPDVFHVAIQKGVDIHIADVYDDKVKSYIPEWFLRHIPARTFLLFPVMVKNTPIALFYADKDEPGAIDVSEKVLGLLRALRNQCVLAIKQKMM